MQVEKACFLLITMFFRLYNIRCSNLYNCNGYCYQASGIRKRLIYHCAPDRASFSRRTTSQLPSVLSVGIDDIVQRCIKGVLTEQLVEFIATFPSTSTRTCVTIRRIPFCCCHREFTWKMAIEKRWSQWNQNIGWMNWSAKRLSIFMSRSAGTYSSCQVVA